MNKYLEYACIFLFYTILNNKILNIVSSVYLIFMNVNFQQLAPILAACMTTGGVIFQIGKHAEKLELIGI